jgi:hypothetical protein
VDFDPKKHPHRVKKVATTSTIYEGDSMTWGVAGIDTSDDVTIASNDPNFSFGGTGKGPGSITSPLTVATGVTPGIYTVTYSITLNTTADPVIPSLVIDTLPQTHPDGGHHDRDRKEDRY